MASYPAGTEPPPSPLLRRGGWLKEISGQVHHLADFGEGLLGDGAGLLGAGGEDVVDELRDWRRSGRGARGSGRGAR